MKVFVTTVIRRVKNRKVTGYLYKINWRNLKVEKRIPIPATTMTVPFWSSRGGNRGGRGICFHNNILYVATAVTIRKYDTNLNFIEEICNPKFAGMHEIRYNQGIWITSTIHDAIFKIDTSGKVLFEWYGNSSKKLQKALRYKKRKLRFNMNFPKKDYEKYYLKYCRNERLHLNSVCIRKGNVYTFSCKKNALIQIHPHERVVFKDNTLGGTAHNCLFITKNGILLNDTRKQKIKLYNSNTKKCVKEISTKIIDDNIISHQFVTPGWQRGLAKLHGNVYLVGTSPLTVFEVNIKNNKIGKRLSLDNKSSHCVHDICVVRGVK